MVEALYTILLSNKLYVQYIIALLKLLQLQMLQHTINGKPHHKPDKTILIYKTILQPLSMKSVLSVGSYISVLNRENL